MFRDYQALGVLLAGAIGTLAATTARAEPSDAGWLSVERSEAAASCPDAPSLRRATEALFETAPHERARLIHVDFARNDGVFVATLRRVDSDHAGRQLRDAHSDCEPLAQAVVTALALMLETRASESAQPKPEPPPRSVPPEPPLVVPPPPSPPRYELALGVEGGAAFGVIDGWSPLLAGHVAFSKSALRVSLGALWLPTLESELGPGHVDVGLTAITTRACLRLFDSTALDLFSCSGLFGGLLSARAQGYTSDFARNRPWLAVPIELFFAASLAANDDAALKLRAGATLLIPARRETFSVQGLGAAVEPTRVAGLLWLGFDSSLLW